MWTLKTERAKEHKEELLKEIKAFFDSKPYTIGTKTILKQNVLFIMLPKLKKYPIR